MMKPVRRTAFAALALITGLAIPQIALAQHVSASDAWARASAPTARTGAAFLTINGGTTADTLLSAETPVAERVELHTHINDNGVMRMREVESIAIPPGQATVLQPGGLHVMLFGLKQPLTEGSSFPLHLNFQHKYPLDIVVTVRGAAAMGSGESAGQGHSHDTGHEGGHTAGHEGGHGHDHAPAKAEHKHGQ